MQKGNSSLSSGGNVDIRKESLPLRAKLSVLNFRRNNPSPHTRRLTPAEHEESKILAAELTRLQYECEHPLESRSSMQCIDCGTRDPNLTIIFMGRFTKEEQEKLLATI